MRKEEKGITLVALSVTIAILLILAGISIRGGSHAIQNAQIEELKTNMLLIQAKAKEFVEDATFKMGINPDETKKNEVRQAVYAETAKLEKTTNVPEEFGIMDVSTCYWMTEKAFSQWGLDKIKLKKGERYLVQFKEEEQAVEVYNTIGKDGKHSLTDLEKVKSE